MGYPHDGAIFSVPIDGGPIVTIAADQDSPSSLAVDSRDVYWASGDSVLMTSLVGGSVTTLATGQQPGSIALDGQSVYWSNGSRPGTIVAVPNGGGVVETIVSASTFGLGEDLDTLSGITIEGPNVYWATDSGLLSIRPADRTLVRSA